MFGRGKTKAAGGPRIADEDRLLRARVDIIVAYLGVGVWLNPSWALVAIVPFLGPFQVFGDIPAWRLAAAVLVHIVNAAVSLFLAKRYRRDPRDTRRWHTLLTLFQAQIGLGWATLPWFLWVPDNSLNHVMIVIPIVAVLWSYSVSRTTDWALYFIGVLPIFALTAIRLVTVQSVEAHGLSVLFVVAFLYTCIIATKVKHETDRGIHARLANEDLTSELRGARDDALRKRYEAEAANASKTTFLANMSHELRTPLNAILGFSDIIANETFGPVGVTRYRDYAQDINMSGSHLLSIINDILDIAKIESGKMVVDPVCLEPQRIIDNAMRVVAAKAREKGQHLSVRIAPGANEVFADERAFKQIVMNLVSNAVKFTQMGGAITVHGRGCEDGGFELIVEDDGPGIDASLLNKIFQPFNQVDNRYNRQEGGTGLGLSLVRGLAVLHGGKVWIETDLGAGVRAHVQFPPHSQERRKNPPTAARLTA